jgi:D-alanyl-D-alanine dipeptidase
MKSVTVRTSLLCAILMLGACQTSDPYSSAGFVKLPAAPDVQTDVRYFTTDNFVGEAINGYEASLIYLTREARDALQRVIADAQVFGLGVKVFDAYRPQQAVDHFVAWAEDLSDIRMKARYYPNVEKANLFRDGYIAARSGHSRGSTLDLTLFDLTSGRELDMGTPWDYFDLTSWGGSDAVTVQQRANRALLRALMTKHGFMPLREEWWHFTLENEPYPDTYFNFLVR